MEAGSNFGGDPLDSWVDRAPLGRDIRHTHQCGERGIFL